jgi:hypothetical protein
MSRVATVGSGLATGRAEPRTGSLARFRAPLLATLLAIPNAHWIIQIEKVRDGPYPSTISLFMNALLWLVLLLVANQVLGRWLPRWKLSPAELLLIYTMLSITTAMAGMDFTPVLIQMIAHPTYYAREGVVDSQVLQHLPPQLINTDYDALRAYFVGNSTLYRWEHVRAWLTPVAYWMAVYRAAVVGDALRSVAGASPVDGIGAVGVPAGRAAVADGGAVRAAVAFAADVGRIRRRRQHQPAQRTTLLVSYNPRNSR